MPQTGAHTAYISDKREQRSTVAHQNAPAKNEEALPCTAWPTCRFSSIYMEGKLRFSWSAPIEHITPPLTIIPIHLQDREHLNNFAEYSREKTCRIFTLR